MTSSTHWHDYYHGNTPAFNEDAVFKAGEGAAFTDPKYAANVTAAAAHGVHSSAYYALHAGTLAEAQAQAHRAVGIIGTRGAMFDVEEWPAESGSPSGIASLPVVLSAVDYYHSHAGIMNVIYLPRSQWEKMGRPDLTALTRRGLHLVNANYNASSAAPGSPAWDSYGGMPVWAVQYAPCNNYAQATIDQVRAVFSGTPAPTVPPAHTPITYTVKPGDTFDGIAAAHHLTEAALKALNPKAGHPAGNVNLIYARDVLVIAK